MLELTFIYISQCSAYKEAEYEDKHVRRPHTNAALGRMTQYRYRSQNKKKQSTSQKQKLTI